MRHNRHALPDQTTRALSSFNRRSLVLELVRGLFVDPPAAGGGGAAPAPAAAPAAPAAAKPAAAAPAAAPAPAAGEKPAAAPAAAPAPKGDELDQIIGPAAEKPPVEPPKPATLDEQRKYLVEKAGVKAEDAAKLTEADLKTQYDAAKAKEAAPGEVKPEDIKLTIPEGIKVDEAAQAEFKAALLDPKLKPQERAQKLFDMHTAALKNMADQTFLTWKNTQIEWQKTVRADKEIGGAAYDTTRASITKAIEQIMGKEAPGVYEAMKFTGAGNNPAIVRLMARIGKLLGEGDHVGGDAPGAAKSRSFAQRVAAMYPSASGSQSAAPAGG